MKKKPRVIRPTGIIRTLPSLYEDEGNVGHQAYLQSVAAVERGENEEIYIALAQMPQIDVLHL